MSDTDESPKRYAFVLLPGFLKLAARFGQPFHLLELGASAGLNQNWDKFSYQTETWQRGGASDVSITTDWRAPIPDHLNVPIEIASRSALFHGGRSPLSKRRPMERVDSAWPR